LREKNSAAGIVAIMITLKKDHAERPLRLFHYVAELAGFGSHLIAIPVLS
jgi:hypothetical protein